MAILIFAILAISIAFALVLHGLCCAFADMLRAGREARLEERGQLLTGYDWRQEVADGWTEDAGEREITL